MVGPGDNEEHTGEFDTDPEATAATVVEGQRSKRSSFQLDRGDPLGRYIILGPLGEGGMGSVYRAYDPELERRIALKLVKFRRSRGSTRARERLLREAQALAQLSHPNVVAVHDVGSLEGDLFIAMELVDGETLRDWLEAKPRELREILDIFIAAGHGLEAAHAAGLVHRDFKPDNIVIGVDGRTRVIDFGLARTAGDGGSTDDISEDDDSLGDEDSQSIGSRSGRGLSAQLTQAGSVVGTPAYMAPEQRRGRDVDARSDQFSFCVALWRAVYGVHPYANKDEGELEGVDKLIRRLDRGELEPADGSSVPSWLRTALLRGLSSNPARRYSSMSALLDVISHDPAALRRRIGLGIGVAAVACAIVFAVFGRAEEQAPCTGGDARFASVWGDAKRAQVTETFTKLRGDSGAKSAKLFTSAFDDFGRRWVAVYTEACRATRVLGDQSAELLDRRMACLDRKLGKIAALSDGFVAIDRAQMIDRAVLVAASLPSLDRCSDDEALTALTAPPETAEVRERVAAVRDRIDKLEVSLLSGDATDAAAVSAELVTQSEDIGYAPLLAEALFLNGIALRKLKKGKEAEEALYRAALVAAEAHDDDRIAQVWNEVVWVVGYTQKRIDDGLALRPVVEAAAKRTGEKTRRADMLNNIGALLRKKGDFDAAREALEETLEIWKQVYGEDHMQVSKAHNNLGNVLADLGRYREARDHHQRVIAIRRQELGPTHPAVASSYNNLGIALLELGEYADARDAYTRALGIYEQLDPNTGDVTMVLNNLGSTLAELGEHEKARAMQERAIEIQKRTLGPDDAELGISMNNLGDLDLKLGEHESALTNYRAARDIWTRGLGADHTYVGYANTGIGFAQLGRKDWAAALASFEKALTLWTAQHGEDHPPASGALLGIGLAEIGQGRPARAVAPLERAIELRAKGAPTVLAEAEFALARALSATGRQKQRALELADKAREAFAKSDADADRVTAIDEWKREPDKN